MSLYKNFPFFVLLVVAADVAAIVGSFLLAYQLRFSGLLIPIHKGIPSFEGYTRAIAVLVPVYLIFFRAYGLYQPERHIRRIYELLNLFKAISLATVCLMALTFIYREFSYSRMVFLLAWIFLMFFCGLGRYFLIQLEYFLRRTQARQRVLLIGANRNSRDLIRWSRDNPHYGQDMVGILSDDHEIGRHFEKVSILGTLRDFDAVIDKNQVDEVILADSNTARTTVSELMLRCENKMINFKLAADFYGLMTRHVDVEYISNVPLLGLKSLPLDDPWNRWMKRVFDLVVSSGLFILLSPCFILIALIIKLTDHAPIFYAQERVGRDGKRFKLYKFRTMRTDAEKKTGPVWAGPDDDRATPVGHFLRRMNLDELPQLWNVFVGNMSLVGPRPERPHFVEQFREQIPRYMARHKIKSGLTGWAQIHGLRGNTSVEERIKYDLYYMENWTLMLDAEILLATIFAYKNAY